MFKRSFMKRLKIGSGTRSRDTQNLSKYYYRANASAAATYEYPKSRATAS